ncbi:MAG TPA: cellulose biosynthesis cyclic di-GMP-binding regulatory protein BcsB [Anaerolineales bacterium]|nr:cellulose biosynthesis cyclic di-GMP-binding regulatory protein BcsB [Anaerolineales bacterium]
MTRDKFYQVVMGVSLSLSLLLVPQKNTSAQGQNFIEVPLETFHDEKPVELQGLISNQTLNIPIPQNWLLGEENWLELKISASPLLDSARSSLTISLNGLQIGSYRITKIGETKQLIPISANMFTRGNNILTFTGTLYLPNDTQTNCQNWDDPSRWLVIQPGGLLHLSFTRRDLQVNLSNFPQSFIEPLDKYMPAEARKQTLIVLPADRTQDDLTSLSTISYVLGSHAAAGSDWQPEIAINGQFNPDMVLNRNLIFVGTVPNEFQDRVSSDKDYIAMFPSPWGIGNAVMIIGDRNRQDGFSPASIFSDKARSVLLQGNVAFVDQLAPPAPLPFQNNFSLEDLGYLDRTVRGIGQQNLIYSLYIPYDIEPVLAHLNLELVHAPDLDTLNSSFTVYLNGFSIAGILPTARSSTGEPITISLPAKRFRRGINFIRIAFDLHVPSSSCERALESVWATVLNSSAVEINYRNRIPIPSLKSFPLPFSDYPGSAYVIPDQYSQKDLGYISRLSFMLGTSAYQANRPPEVMTATSFAHKKAEYSNVILVGLPSVNSVTRNTNDLLPQPFAKDGDSLEENYGVYLPTSNKDASVGLMQIIPSPWKKGGTVLVLTGTDQEGLDWTWDVILNPALRGSFGGNLMVVGSENRIDTTGPTSVQENPQAWFQQVADASNIPVIGPILQKSGKLFPVPALIAIGVALLVVICALWIMRAARARAIQVAHEKLDQGEEDER